MAELLAVLGLAAKALQEERLGSVFGRQHLQGHHPPRYRVPGFVDRPHRSGSDMAHHLVLTEVVVSRSG